jgi:hypothetical protein
VQFAFDFGRGKGRELGGDVMTNCKREKEAIFKMICPYICTKQIA